MSSGLFFADFMLHQHRFVFDASCLVFLVAASSSEVECVGQEDVVFMHLKSSNRSRMGFHFGWCGVEGQFLGVLSVSSGLCRFQDTSASIYIRTIRVQFEVTNHGIENRCVLFGVPWQSVPNAVRVDSVLLQLSSPSRSKMVPSLLIRSCMSSWRVLRDSSDL